MIFAGELKAGHVIKREGGIWSVLRSKYNQSGRNEATITLKMKNVETGQIIDTTLKGGEKLDDVTLDYREMQLIFINGDTYGLMDNETYDQIEVNKEELGDNVNFLTENGTVIVSFYEERPVSYSLPKNVVLTITYTEPGEKGDSTGNPLKPATLETGFEIGVPLFCGIGEKIIVDTRTGEYLSRA